MRVSRGETLTRISRVRRSCVAMAWLLLVARIVPVFYGEETPASRALPSFGVSVASARATLLPHPKWRWNTIGFSRVPQAQVLQLRVSIFLSACSSMPESPSLSPGSPRLQAWRGRAASLLPWHPLSSLQRHRQGRIPQSVGARHAVPLLSVPSARSWKPTKRPKSILRLLRKRRLWERFARDVNHVILHKSC